MKQAEQIFAKHWTKQTGKLLDETTKNHMQYAIDAIDEALKTNIDESQIDESQMIYQVLSSENLGYFEEKLFGFCQKGWIPEGNLSTVVFKDRIYFSIFLKKPKHLINQNQNLNEKIKTP